MQFFKPADQAYSLTKKKKKNQVEFFELVAVSILFSML